jgi:hypothetical protein
MAKSLPHHYAKAESPRQDARLPATIDGAANSKNAVKIADRSLADGDVPVR